MKDMKVLLVEDDEHKRVGIEQALRDCRGSVEVFVAASLYDAINSLDIGPFDLVVLDMAIPSHPTAPGEGSPVSFLTGGLDVLLELSARGRSDRCIIITQFPEIEISQVFYQVSQATAAIKEQLDYEVIDCIAYTSENEGWLHQFRTLLDAHGYSCT